MQRKRRGKKLMGRIVNPTLMRTGMNAIKKNVDSYGSNYRKAKSTLARYSNEAISAKGEAVDAMINQVLCYESVMDMFIVVAESMIKDCDEMSIRVGDEYLNEDSILAMIEVQKNIRQRCSERIDDYRHKQTQFATAAPLAEHCRMQVNLNAAAKERADIAITALNNKIKKIDEIESNTNNLFLESKSALAELNKCISELDKSGKGGFTYDSMPAWAVAIPLESMPKSSLYFDESAIFLVHALSISFDIFPPTFISGIPMLMPVSITDTTPFAMVSELSFLNRFFRYSALARDT